MPVYTGIFYRYTKTTIKTNRIISDKLLTLSIFLKYFCIKTMAKSERKAQKSSKVVQSNPTKVRLICNLISFFSVMPSFIGKAFSWLFERVAVLFKTRSYTTSITNLELCLPDASDIERKKIAKQSLRHMGLLFFEAAKIWKKCQGEQYIEKIHGEEAVIKLLKNKQGILFTGSHIGNWEVALYYLGSRYPFHCMYRPPRQLEMDEVINQGRCQNSTNMIKGDSRGVMELIKVLKKGDVAAVLSDQEPGRRAGIFVPFCGKNALTMTLVQKIQQKSNAALFQVAAIKTESGKYDIHILPVVIDPKLSEQEYAAGVNKALEHIIRRYPEQYQWSYKRFKTTECGKPNPYGR